MLSIGKLGAGQETYYTNSVAKARDDYYAGKGESPGRWAGAGAHRLGLEGVVKGDELTALMAGLHPVTGDQLRSVPVKNVVGFDLTFSAPKSVSVLWALGDDRVSGPLVEAHEAAVRAAMGYMEQTAMFVRRGKAGKEFQPAETVWAEFRHRSSRAKDPQMHTHCVMPNMAVGQDGRSTALHHPTMYRAAKTAGYLYQAHLRAIVSDRLGLEWGPVRKGAAELAVIPDAVRSEFSRRRAEMEARAKELGADLGSRATSGRMAVQTRDRKDAIDMPAWLLEVRDRAVAQGMDMAELEVLLREADARAQEAAPVEQLDFSAVSTHLVGAAGLTEKHTSFGTRAILREFAEAAGQGATVDEVRAYGATFATSNPEVLQLVNGEGTLVNEWSTQNLVDVEREMIQGAAARKAEGCAELDERKVLAAVKRFGLNDDQRAAVVRTTTSGNGVDVIQAWAGSGKTFCAGAIRVAYEKAGYTVVGVAPTGRAVRELNDEAGIPSRTLAGAVLRLTSEPFTWRTVIVVDEAGMAGTREMAELAAAARAAGAKMITIGDPGQLHSVQAGGWLTAIGGRVGYSLLTEVMRQRDKAERRALGRLHARDATGYLEWARENGRVDLTGTVAGAMAKWEAITRDVDLSSVALIVRSNELRETLNEQARAVHRDRENLGEDVYYGMLPVAVGDRVICRRNQHMYDVDNGTRGTVVRSTGTVVEVRLDGSDQTRSLPASYVAAHVEHAYALTVHGVQSSTVDRAIVVGEPYELTNGLAYTALSRAQRETWLFALQEQRDRDREEYAPGELQERLSPRQLLDGLARRMATRDDESVAFDRLAFEQGLDRELSRDGVGLER